MQSQRAPGAAAPLRASLGDSDGDSGVDVHGGRVQWAAARGATSREQNTRGDAGIAHDPRAVLGGPWDFCLAQRAKCATQVMDRCPESSAVVGAGVRALALGRRGARAGSRVTAGAQAGEDVHHPDPARRRLRRDPGAGSRARRRRQRSPGLIRAAGKSREWGGVKSMRRGPRGLRLRAQGRVVVISRRHDARRSLLPSCASADGRAVPVLERVGKFAGCELRFEVGVGAGVGAFWGGVAAVAAVAGGRQTNAFGETAASESSTSGLSRIMLLEVPGRAL